MDEPFLSIKAVAQKTGLSPHVIRIWEKRYGVVSPDRTGTNRRRYTQEEVEHLALLGRLTKEGHPIGILATLSREALTQMIREAKPVPAPVAAGGPEVGAAYLRACIDAIRQHDRVALEDTLAKAELSLGTQGMLVQVAAPLAQNLGDLWREGALTAAHEHFASAVLRTVLALTGRGFAPIVNAPVFIVATPAGQVHELGALLAAAVATNLGWRVIYLGPSLSAAEIAGAAIQHRARAVGLSLVYPEDDAALPNELRRLRQLLPASTAILAGGRAVLAYRAPLEEIGALQSRDLPHLGVLLDSLRTAGK